MPRLKTSLVLALTAALVLPGWSQITVTSGSLMPVGTEFTYYTGGQFDVDPGPPGPNQTWDIPDYSLTFITPEVFVNPAGTAYADSFPGATHCQNQAGNTVYAYFQITGNQCLQLGFAPMQTQAINYEPPSLIAPLPLTYPANSWTRVYQSDFVIQFPPPIGPVVVTTRDSVIVTVDAWGTITTQYGTFQVLRTFEHKWSTSITMGVPTTTESYGYSWLDTRGIAIYSLFATGDDPDFNQATINLAEMGGVSADPAPMPVVRLLSLEQNYPNPFNPETNIAFNLPTSGNVSLKVFNVLGEEVATMINGFRNSGPNTVTFDASALSGGTYIYRLEANGLAEERKMILLK